MRKIILITLLGFYTVSGFGQIENDTVKKVNIAAVPVINYDHTFGLVVGAMGQMIYKLNKNDTISPSSSTGVFGIFTTNKTYFTAAFQKLYFKEDTWRIMFAAGTGNINFQYWQEIPIIGGFFIGFNTEAKFVMMRAERKVYKQFYAGVNSIYSKTKTEYDLPGFIPDSLRFDERNMNSIGYQLNYDMREHQINPYGGFNIEFKNWYFREWMNSGNNFNKYELTYNHYYKIKNERNILATRVTATISTGDVPFLGQNIVGQNDIRGYSSGKYRNDEVYAIQAEYRWRFYKKFGMVGFLGIATAIENITELPKSELLPGIGVGVRYLMLPDERINIGFDVAVGKDDWGIYFRIGESFGQ